MYIEESRTSNNENNLENIKECTDDIMSWDGKNKPSKASIMLRELYMYLEFIHLRVVGS